MSESSRSSFSGYSKPPPMDYNPRTQLEVQLDLRLSELENSRKRSTVAFPSTKRSERLREDQALHGLQSLEKHIINRMVSLSEGGLPVEDKQQHSETCWLQLRKYWDERRLEDTSFSELQDSVCPSWKRGIKSGEKGQTLEEEAIETLNVCSERLGRLGEMKRGENLSSKEELSPDEVYQQLTSLADHSVRSLHSALFFDKENPQLHPATASHILSEINHIVVPKMSEELYELSIHKAIFEYHHMSYKRWKKFPYEQLISSLWTR